jgi:hypothetical protein
LYNTTNRLIIFNLTLSKLICEKQTIKGKRKNMPEGKEGFPAPEKSNIAGLTNAELEKRIESYIFPAKHGMEGQYRQTKWQLEEMAEGGGDPDVRSQYYAGWTDDDFKKILKRLQEEEEKLGL